jgi:uncharacterized membrane protein YbhN (UPF0104 family)
MNKSLKKKMFFAIVLGFIGYAVAVFLTDIQQLKEVGGQYNWAIFPLVLALAFGNYVIRFVRWQLYLNRLKVDISLKDSAAVFFSGLVMSISPGKFGELLKAEYIKNINSTPRRRTGPVIFAERLTDLLGVSVLASFGIFHFNYGRVIFLAVLGIIAALLVIISSKTLSIGLIKLMKPLPVIGPRVPKLLDAYQSIAELSTPGMLITTSLLSIAAWSSEAFGFYLVLHSLPGVTIEIPTAFFIYAFSILVGAISMMPGGLGATESTMAGLLTLVKLPFAFSILATLITRMATLWFAVGVGIVCTSVWYRLLEGQYNKSPLVEDDDELETAPEA